MPSSQRQISPWWAIVAGLGLVPFASGLNVVVMYLLLPLLYKSGATLPSLLWKGSLMAFIDCLPLTLITFGLITSWNEGHHRRTRLWCLFPTFPAFTAWIYFCTVVLPGNSLELNYAAMFLPFLWTLLFPLFAAFAREPKRRAS